MTPVPTPSPQEPRPGWKSSQIVTTAGAFTTLILSAQQMQASTPATDPLIIAACYLAAGLAAAGYAMGPSRSRGGQ